MTSNLDGRTILVVEDEALIAMDISMALEQAGAKVVGPAASLQTALEASRKEEFDAAILDIMLRREEVYPVADELAERGTPFVFHSAHVDEAMLTQRYGEVPLQQKPSDPRNIVDMLADLLADA